MRVKEATFPSAWRTLDEVGGPQPAWLAASSNMVQLRSCEACGLRIHVRADTYDGVWCEVVRFSPEADAVLRADATPAEVVDAALRFPAAQRLAALWFVNATFSATPFLLAMRALASKVTDTEAAFFAIALVHQVVQARPRLAIALARDTATTRTLFNAAFGAVPRESIASRTTLHELLAGLVHQLHRADPTAALPTVSLPTSPEARQRETFDALRNVGDGTLGVEALPALGGHLDGHEQRALPLAIDDVKVALRAIAAAAPTDASRAHPPSWALRKHLGWRLRMHQLPPEMRDAVLATVDPDRKWLEAPVCFEPIPRRPVGCDACFPLQPTEDPRAPMMAQALWTRKTRQCARCGSVWCQRHGLWRALPASLAPLCQSTASLPEVMAVVDSDDYASARLDGGLAMAWAATEAAGTTWVEHLPAWVESRQQAPGATVDAMLDAIELLRIITDEPRLSHVHPPSNWSPVRFLHLCVTRAEVVGAEATLHTVQRLRRWLRRMEATVGREAFSVASDFLGERDVERPRL
ncbi:MAG: hypothetical protein JNG84_06895 [Archangium sp.]|nr:hypothetical protein [Archangium sp.]